MCVVSWAADVRKRATHNNDMEQDWIKFNTIDNQGELRREFRSRL